MPASTLPTSAALPAQASALRRPAPPQGNTEAEGFYPWPTPPFHIYGAPTRWVPAQACELEESDAQTRSCFLVGIDPESQTVVFQTELTLPPLSLEFSELRCLTLKTPLKPRDEADGSPFSDVLGDRYYVDYTLQMKRGSALSGRTLGYTETAMGWFLFKPRNGQGLVERMFVPRDACTAATWRPVCAADALAQPVEAAPLASAADFTARTEPDDTLTDAPIVTAQQLLAALDKQARKPVLRVGEALTQMGYIDDTQLHQALSFRKPDDTTPLGQLLVNLGFLSRKKLTTALVQKMGYPMVDVALFPIDADALRKVPSPVAQRLNILPLLLRPPLLVVAAADPTLHGMLEELEFLAHMRVVAVLADPVQMQRISLEAYQRMGFAAAPDSANALGLAPLATGGDLLESLELHTSLPSNQPESDVPLKQSDNTLVQLVNTMIIEASARGVSDIHVECQPDQARVRIRFRRDGLLSLYLELPHTFRAALVARLKSMADLDVAEQRRPQDGKIEFHKFSPRHRMDLRITTIPTVNGLEDVVMRRLSSAKPLALEQLGLTATHLAGLRAAVSHPSGMVLCVGPTGSGKTTTLHSVLSFLNTPERKIWTAEDPIEISQPGLRQVQINPSIDWTFAKALRSFLRADPDVIMVGEIHDPQTAYLAIDAALTGHLLLSTLHTHSAAETVTRLIDMSMDPFNFADALRAVLAQRLVRRLCTHCRVPQEASDTLMQELLDDYVFAFPEGLRPPPAQVLAQWQATYAPNGRLMQYHAPGCDHCQGSGFLGRLGLHELLSVTPGLHALIQTSARSELILREAFQSGDFRSLHQDGIVKVLQGLTSLAEVRARCNV